MQGELFSGGASEDRSSGKDLFSEVFARMGHAGRMG